MAAPRESYYPAFPSIATSVSAGGYNRNKSYTFDGAGMPQSWVSNGTAPAMSSTVFPCGHIVAYTGAPPMYCTSCGRAHQNQALHEQNYYQGHTHLAAHTSADVGTTVSAALAAYAHRPKKDKTNLDWLDEQIDRVRKRAFSA